MNLTDSLDPGLAGGLGPDPKDSAEQLRPWELPLLTGPGGLDVVTIGLSVLTVGLVALTGGLAVVTGGLGLLSGLTPPVVPKVSTDPSMLSRPAVSPFNP